MYQWSRKILCIGRARLCRYIYGNICEHNNTPFNLTNSVKINVKIAKISPPSLISFWLTYFSGDPAPPVTHLIGGGGGGGGQPLLLIYWPVF